MGILKQQYKIKKETTGNKTGEAFSLTIPRVIAESFKNCKFSIEVTQTAIIYKSGIDLNHLKKEAQKVEFSDIN